MLTYQTLYKHNYIEHKRHDEYHHMNKPAILWRDGDYFFCQYGQLHRTVGPATNKQFARTLYYHRDTPCQSA